MSSQSVRSRNRVRVEARFFKDVDGGGGAWFYYRGNRLVDAPKDYRRRVLLIRKAVEKSRT